jgi:Predicted S-adenosylmethionine-dependent methyltransferase involved in cell envelope biogenesis
LGENPSRYLPTINQKEESTYLEKINNKAVKPSENEIMLNPRSRSAKLRSVIKMGNDFLSIDRRALKMERLFQLEEKYNG